MRYIKLFAEAPYAGCSTEEYYAYPDDFTDEMLNDAAEELGNDHCSAYEYIATRGIEEEDYATFDDYDLAMEEATDDYWADCSYGWVEVSYEEYEENGGEVYGEN